MPSADTVALAVAQFAPTGDAEANLGEIARLAHVAADRGARVVVFPEYSSAFVEPFDERLVAMAQDLDGPFTAALTALASRLGIHLVAGLLERGSDGRRVRNTVAAVDATGPVATYRKLHLYDAFGQRESDWVQPGDLETPQTLHAGDLTFGIMTCYDLRFPEHARIVVDAGAEVLVLPAAWVAGDDKLHHWRTLATARAIENTVYVVAAAQGGARYTGHSIVVDPLGRVIAEAGSGDETISADISPGTVTAARDVNPSLANRRIR